MKRKPKKREGPWPQEAIRAALDAQMFFLDAAQKGALWHFDNRRSNEFLSYSSHRDMFLKERRDAKKRLRHIAYLSRLLLENLKNSEQQL